MGVWFNEEANVSIANDLTIEQRRNYGRGTVSIMDVSCKPPQAPEKQLTFILDRHFSQGYSSRRLCPGQSTSDTSPRGYFAVLADEERMKQQQRRNRIRNYVRFVVDEHKSIKAMGITETISLFRLSAACTKPDVVEARQRAMSVSKYNPSTASTKYNPATNHHMRSRVPMSMTIRAF
jgi:hypothetical protein